MTATQDDQAGSNTPVPGVVYLVHSPETAYANDEIDFAGLFRVIWCRKWWILTFTGLVACLAVVYALNATPWYRAEAVLMPRQDNAGSGLSGQLAQLGGLASMVGLNLGQGGKDEPLALLRSKGFARRFIEQNGLLAVLSEDRKHGAPDLRDATDDFVRSVLRVTEDKKTGLVVIGIEWKDGAVAAEWANQLARQLNDEMRQRALAEAERNIRYLRERLGDTDYVSLQQAVARLLETELQKEMLASGTDEYALRMIDEARAPVRRERPKRTVIVLVATFAAMLVAIATALLADPLRRLVAAARAG